MSRRGLAKIDVLLIVLVLIAGLIYLTRMLPMSGSAGPGRTACLANLSAISNGLSVYLEANGQRWPYVAKLRTVPLHNPPWPTLSEVLKPYMSADSKNVFRCPADRRVLSPGSALLKQFPMETTWYETEGTSYEWMWGEVYGGVKVGDESLVKAKGFGLGRADQPLLADFDSFHTGDSEGQFNTLNADLKPRTARTSPK